MLRGGTGSDIFVSFAGQSYLFYESTVQGTSATDAGTLEVVGLDIVGTRSNWTVVQEVLPRSPNRCWRRYSPRQAVQP